MKKSDKIYWMIFLSVLLGSSISGIFQAVRILYPLENFPMVMLITYSFVTLIIVVIIAWMVQHEPKN